MTKQSIKGYLPDNCANLDNLPHIQGYDFNKKFNFSDFLKSYSATGFQAANVSHAIEVIKAMKRENAAIFLAYTSNMVSSGVRDIIRYLVEHKLIHALITTAGGVEEDIIKTLKPFVLGTFNADGAQLFDKGINRTGNIFITNDRYAYFEKFLTPILEDAYKEQIKKKKIFCSTDLIGFVGKYVNDKTSILHWAHMNSIPVFCPALTDGSFGDMLFWHKQRHPDFQLDIVEDMQKIVKLSMNAEKTGAIILGGGSAKHYTLNAQIFREGCEYAVFINTGSEYDGSDSGAQTNEAVTWGKIKPNALQVKVTGDATIIFPLVIAGVLQT